MISLGPHDSSLDFCCTGNASILKMMDSPGIKEHIGAALAGLVDVGKPLLGPGPNSFGIGD